MVVVTRPELGDKPPEHHAEPVGPPEPMNTRLANALVTQAPMTMVQLDTVRLHFERLAQMMLISGPVFSPMRRSAIEMHNKAVRRINGHMEDIRRRAKEDEEERLLEIER